MLIAWIFWDDLKPQAGFAFPEIPKESEMIDFIGEKKNSIFGLCPYLGQKADPGTAFSYPSELNYCYHARPMASVELEYQAEYCLASRFPECEEYVSDPHAPLPVNFHHSSGGRTTERRGKFKWVWIIALGLVGIIAAWLLIARGRSLGQTTVDPTVIPGSTATKLEIPTGLSQTRTPIPTAPPTPASTPTLRPLMGLETLLGIDLRFVIVQVKDGDSLELIAGRHNTTAAALLACNYRMPVPLIPGWAIVVPLNFTDMQGIPVFEIYSVTKEISLVDLKRSFPLI
jgi:hypothetical protein